MPKTSGYRKRHDRNQAIVTLTDAVTRKRRDYWLGEPGSPESRERYHRVIAEWEANGRRLPDLEFTTPDAPAGAAEATTVSVVCSRYLRGPGAQHDESERSHYRALIRLLRAFYGTTPAESFGPRRLHRLRDECLNLELFTSLAEARVVLEDFRLEYNHRRPHSSLNYQTPAAFAASCRQAPPLGLAALAPAPAPACTVEKVHLAALTQTGA